MLAWNVNRVVIKNNETVAFQAVGIVMGDETPVFSEGRDSLGLLWRKHMVFLAY